MQYSHGGRATWAARTDGDKARTRKDFLRTTAIVTKAGVLTFADRLAFPELDGCRTGTYTMRGLDFLPSHTLHESDSVAAICGYTTNQHGLNLDGDMLLTPNSTSLHRPFDSVSCCYLHSTISPLSALQSQLGVSTLEAR